MMDRPRLNRYSLSCIDFCSSWFDCYSFSSSEASKDSSIESWAFAAYFIDRSDSCRSRSRFMGFLKISFSFSTRSYLFLFSLLPNEFTRRSEFLVFLISVFAENWVGMLSTMSSAKLSINARSCSCCTTRIEARLPMLLVLALLPRDLRFYSCSKEGLGASVVVDRFLSLSWTCWKKSLESLILLIDVAYSSLSESESLKLLDEEPDWL